MRILQYKYYFAAVLCCGVTTAMYSYSDVMDIMDWQYKGPPMALPIEDTKENGIAFETSVVLAFEHLQDMSPGKQLRDLSGPGFQQIELNYRESWRSERTDEFLRYLIKTGVSLESNWDIGITGGGRLPNMTLVSELVQIVPNITNMKWRNMLPIPKYLLESIESRHPNCHLYYDLSFDDLAPPRSRRNVQAVDEHVEQSDIIYESIFNSTVLYSLTASIGYGRPSSSSARMDRVQQILTSNPSLRELILSVDHYGCEDHSGHQPYAFNFMDKNSTFPPLEVLKLSGYGFEDKPDGNKWREWEAGHPRQSILVFPWNRLPQSLIDYVGYQRIWELGGLQTQFIKRDNSLLRPTERTNLDIWLEVMDWSHILTLELTDPRRDVLLKLGGDTLPRLKNLSFKRAYLFQEALNFIGNSSFTLESISLEDMDTSCFSTDNMIISVIDRHGPGLRSLRMNHRHRETTRYRGDSGYNRSEYKAPNNTFLSIDQLSRLLLTSPRLESLDIDIQTTKEWDYNIIDTLASFPELRHLTLRFERRTTENIYDEMEDYDYDTEEHVQSSTSQMKGLGSYLRKKKVGKPFETLDTYIGRENIPNQVLTCRPH